MGVLGAGFVKIRQPIRDAARQSVCTSELESEAATNFKMEWQVHLNNPGLADAVICQFGGVTAAFAHEHQFLLSGRQLEFAIANGGMAASRSTCPVLIR